MNIRHALKAILPTGAKKRLYREQALEYLRTIEVEHDPAKPTIVVLNHFFDQDCLALRNAAEEYNIVVLNAPELMRGAHLYFSQPVIELTAPYLQESEQNRVNWRKECEKLWAVVHERWQPQWVVASNDNFFWIRELIPVARQQGCKTAILDKEGTISPHSWTFEVERAKKFVPCIADLVCVWSERQAEFWRRIGMPVDLVQIVGQPRSDLWFAPLASEIDNYFETKQPIVTFFSYDDTAYIPIERVAQEGLTWRQMKSETHDGIAQLATTNPRVNFVIKTHPQQTDRQELAAKYNRENLRVISGSSIANELIRTSLVVVAFQTTAVIEAMALGRPTIYTDWDPVALLVRDDILPLANAPGILTATSWKMCEEAIRECIKENQSQFQWNRDSIQQRQSFVDQYFFQPDGNASRRFLEALDAHARDTKART